MLINFSLQMKDLDGEPIKDSGRPDAKVFTLASAATQALLATHQDDATLSGNEKADRFVLATKIYVKPGDVTPPVDVTVEEVALIKKLIGKAFSPLIVGQAYALLDPKPALVEKSA